MQVALSEHDIVLTILTDSMELYGSRLQEMRQEIGDYTHHQAGIDFAHYLQGLSTDHMLELSHVDRHRIHNLKYFTWVEQQGKTYEEIQAQWYDRNYWAEVQSQTSEIDGLIEEFNARVGLKE